MMKKTDVIEKNKFVIPVQHPPIFQNHLVLSLSFFFLVLHSAIKKLSCSSLFKLKSLHVTLLIYDSLTAKI